MESDSPVSCSPQSQIPLCLVHRGVRFRCVLFIMESDSAVSCSPPSQIPPCLVHRRLPSVNLGEIKTVPNTQQYLNLFVWALWGLHDENLDLVTHNEFIQIFSLFSAVQPAHNRLHRRVWGGKELESINYLCSLSWNNYSKRNSWNIPIRYKILFSQKQRWIRPLP